MNQFIIQAMNEIQDAITDIRTAGRRAKKKEHMIVLWNVENILLNVYVGLKKEFFMGEFKNDKKTTV